MIVSKAEILTYLGMTSGTSDADSALVTLLHSKVEGTIKRYLGYDPEQTTFVEIVPGGSIYRYVDMSLATYDVIGTSNRAAAWTVDHDRLQLRHVPVRSITSVYENASAYAGDAPGAFSASAALLTEGQDYYVDWDTTGICRSGMLIRVGAWPAVPRSVKVTYVAGYTAAEFDGTGGFEADASPIKLAVITQMGKEFSAAKTSVTKGGAGVVQSLSLDDYSVSFNPQLNSWSVSLLDTVKQTLAPFRNYGTRLI